MVIKRDYKSFDFSLLILVLVLSIFGTIVVGSATGIDSGVPSAIYNSQKIWLISGFFILIAISFMDYQFICKFYIPAYILCVILLILVKFLGEDQDAARWLSLPITLNGREVGIQPSEFAKIFMLIFLSKYIDKMKEKINNILVLISVVMLGLLPVLLTFLQPALSTSILLFAILITMLYVGKINYKYIMAAILVIVPLVTFFYYDLTREEHLIIDKIFQPYQINQRIKPFFNIGDVSEDNLYQTNMSITAIGSGMLTGKGLYNNVTHVPLAYNDFIFAIIGAEFGFAGCVAVLFLIFLIVVRCFIIANRADSLCGRLLAVGTGTMIGCQTFVHVSVALGMLPNTGIPLPFISAGGSSLWINLVSIGLVISVGMTKTKLMFED